MIFKRFSLYLLPSILQGLLSFGTLRFTTRILDAADFGTFALLASFTGLGTAAASMGSGILIYSHYPSLPVEGRKAFLSTLFWAAVVVILVFAAGFLCAWPFLVKYFPALSGIPGGAVLFSLSSMALSLPWLFAMDIAVVEGRSSAYAAITIATTSLSTVSTLLGLYIFHLDIFALFVSALLSSTIAGLGGIMILRPYLRFRVSRKWLREIVKVGSISSMGNLAESLQITAERSLLSVHAGLGLLGTYNFSQQFRQMMFMGVKAVTRSAWPITLEEARAPQLDFRRTGAVWPPVHLMLAMAGVFFATLGRDLIEYISNGKFTEAYVLIALWMIFLIVKNTGRQELGYLTVRKESTYLASLIFVSVAISILFLFLLIPNWGLIGAVLALLAQDLTYRLGISLRARRDVHLPFRDGWAIVGAGIVLLMLAWVSLARPELVARISAFATTEGLLAALILRHAVRNGIFKRSRPVGLGEMKRNRPARSIPESGG